jgi:hypothetical protein
LKNVGIRIYKTIILPVVLYGCETWSLTLREEHQLRCFENRVLRRIFGPKKDEVTRRWRKLHNEEVPNLNSLPSIIRMMKSKRMRWARHEAAIEVMRNSYRLLMEKPEGKGLLGRSRYMWVDSIKLDFEEIVRGGMNWIGLAQGRDKWRALVNAVMSLRVQ